MTCHLLSFGGDGEPSALAKYRGVPNEPERPEEKNRWRRFLEAALPWLKMKWGMAEAVADAKVRQEVARAAGMEARAAQEALKTIQLASQIEEEKLRRAEVHPISIEEPAGAEEFRAELERIRERMEELARAHGTQIKIEIAEEQTVAGAAPGVTVEEDA